MRVVVIMREESEHYRQVATWLGDFKRQTGRDVEVLDPDSPEGAHFCRTYDVVEYPTMLALGNDGQLQNMWRGTALPTINEVSYYAAQD